MGIFKKEEGLFGGASANSVFAFGLVVGITIIAIVGSIFLLNKASKPMNLTADMGALVEDGDVADDTQVDASYPKNDKPNVKAFVMTYCPFGQQAEAGLIPMARLMGDKIEFEPHYVIYSNYRGGGPDYCFDDEDKYCSMHGINELNEGVRQLCIWRDQQDKWFDYVEEINANCSLDEIEDCWSGVAESTGVDVAQVQSCFDNDAEELLAAELALGNEMGVKGSPAVFVNDADYKGGRSPEEYKQGVCSAFNSAPEECAQSLSTDGAAASGGCN